MDCAHGPCTCQHGTIEREGRMYCSDECARAGTENPTECRCAHPDCAAAVVNA